MRSGVRSAASTLYVCNRFQNDLSVFDFATGTELAVFPAGREPIAAALDTRRPHAGGGQPCARTRARISSTMGAWRRRCRSAGHQDVLADVVSLQHGSSSVRGSRNYVGWGLCPGHPPAVEFPERAVPGRHGLGQRQRGQHHRFAETETCSARSDSMNYSSVPQIHGASPWDRTTA